MKLGILIVTLLETLVMYQEYIGTFKSEVLLKNISDDQS